MASISVIIPTYNRAHLISATIESVLAQNYEDFELIVVDDGSTDDTAQVIKGYHDPRLCYLQQANQGGSAARNRGAQEATASYLLFLDSDDLLLPGALSKLWETAQSNPEAAVIGGGYQYIDEQDNVLGEYTPWLLTERLVLELWVLSCPFIPSATLIRADCFRQVGGFDPGQEAAQDWDLWLSIAAAGCTMVWVKEALCRYRLHAGGLTSNIERQKHGVLRALDKVYARNDISKEVQALKGEAYVGAYINLVARKYATQDIQGAQQDLIAAATYATDWVDNGMLLERLMRKGESPIVTHEAEQYRQTVLSHLPDVFTEKNKRRAFARVAAAELFRQQQTGNYAQLHSLWWQVVKNDWHWLKNRGFLSIGIATILGVRSLTLWRKLKQFLIMCARQAQVFVLCL